MTETDYKNLFKRWEELKKQEKNLVQTFNTPGPHVYKLDPNSGKLITEILEVERELKEKHWDKLSSMERASLDLAKWREELISGQSRRDSHE